MVGSEDRRFRFGSNWLDFSELIDDGRIAEAELSLQRLCGTDRLDGLRFLDIGSGSGLSSLAARRLGARVFSFDYDENSVACTARLRDGQRPGDDGWCVDRGSILDATYVASLGEFDIVYSWGVLHHTGAMGEALKQASRLVAPGGLLSFALYRKTFLCAAWRYEKRWYAGASTGAQARARSLFLSAMRLAFGVTRKDFKSYVANYRSNRGMSFEHDVHDWLGGYPYESITPAEVAAFMVPIGLEHVRSFTQPSSIGLLGSGCDEYVYQKSLA